MKKLLSVEFLYLKSFFDTVIEPRRAIIPRFIKLPLTSKLLFIKSLCRLITTLLLFALNSIGTFLLSLALPLTLSLLAFCSTDCLFFGLFFDCLCCWCLDLLISCTSFFLGCCERPARRVNHTAKGCSRLRCRYCKVCRVRFDWQPA